MRKHLFVYLITLISLCVFGFLQKETVHAADFNYNGFIYEPNTDTLNMYMGCQIPLEKKKLYLNSNGTGTAAFKQFLVDNEIPYYNSAGRSINATETLKFCVPVYGNWTNVDNNKVSSKPGHEHAYVGLSRYEKPVPDPGFPDTCGTGTCEDYVKNRAFVYKPWATKPTTIIYNQDGDNVTNSYHASCGKTPTVLQWTNESLNCIPSNTQPPPEMPKNKPSNDVIVKMLNHSIDRFYLAEYPNSTKYNGFFSAYNPLLGYKLTGDKLVDHASWVTYPTTYEAGLFQTYLWSGGKYWYASFPVPPAECLFCDRGDAVLELNVGKSEYNTTERLTGTIKITNNFPDPKYNIASPCDRATTVNNLANCSGNQNKLYISVRDQDNPSKEYFYKVLDFSNIPGNGGTKTISLNELNIYINDNANVEVFAQIPGYKNEKGVRESSYENNHDSKNVTFKATGDAIAKIELAKTTYGGNEPLKGKLIVSNQYRSADARNIIDIVCNNKGTAKHVQCATQYTGGGIVVQSADGSSEFYRKVYALPTNHPGISPGGKYEFNLADFDIKLPQSGDYQLWVWIPKYVNESTYANNEDRATFDVEVDQDVWVTAKTTKPEYRVNENVTANSTVYNRMTTKIATGCTTTVAQGFAQCQYPNDNNKKFYSWKVKNLDTGEIVLDTKKDIASIDSGKQQAFSLQDIKPGFKITKPGNYSLIVSMTVFQGELNEKNNQTSYNFKVYGEDNVKVTIDGQSNYVDEDKMTNVVHVTNNAATPVTGVLIVEVKDKDGNVVHQFPKMNYKAIPPKGTKNYDLSTYNYYVETGNYTIEANITHHTDLPETTYEDNQATYDIIVDPFKPENLSCKSIDVPYSDVIAYNSASTNLTKVCLGQFPNFPSTKVEGGQGSYFYVAYRFFPVPFPAYKITNYDEKGLKQSYEVKEPTNQLGNLNTFINYPSKFESRFANNGFEDLTGPYAAGPHDFYHYLYRGRMFPKTTTFHMVIKDPENNKVPNSEGELVFELDDSCYDTDVLDIKSECRQVQFFLPKEPTLVKGTTENPLNAPKDNTVSGAPDTRIVFPNPGTHTFELKVEEEQIYRYQKDTGTEWQGKNNVLRKPLASSYQAQTIYKFDTGRCSTYEVCKTKEESKMTAPYYYNKNGFTGVLNEVTGKHERDASGNVVGSGNGISVPDGYLYRERGVYRDGNGQTSYSDWVTYHYTGKDGTNPTYPNAPKGKTAIGYEWQRFQILSGTTMSSSGTPSATYESGPVQTQTVTGSGTSASPYAWKLRDDYQNHCYTDQDAFGKAGTWSGNTFTPNSDPTNTCYHDHGKDFHYWKFNWSKPTTFAESATKGFIE